MIWIDALVKQLFSKNHFVKQFELTKSAHSVPSFFWGPFRIVENISLGKSLAAGIGALDRLPSTPFDIAKLECRAHAAK